ncbi:MAG TPA: hypothetical protein VIC57_10505 [Candidatus Dormibacteraeota bacterium]|jgi:hypothetical protein
MSDGYQILADVDAGEDEAEPLGAAARSWLNAAGVVEPAGAPGPRYADAVLEASPAPLATRPNGLEVVTGRTVFHGDGTGRVACPGCSEAADWDWLSEAIGDWDAGGDGRRTCPACGRPLGLNDWGWEPAWAFGFLGLRFWNWPPLRPAFVAEVGRRLGHRIVLVAGRL